MGADDCRFPFETGPRDLGGTRRPPPRRPAQPRRGRPRRTAVHRARRAAARRDRRRRAGGAAPAPAASSTCHRLSGGQRQRVWIAMALAQETDLLLLDEPTTYLDIAHQVEVLDLVRRLNRTRGRTVVLVLHDLNQAARYADHLVAMKSGRVLAEGAPADVVTADLVADVFGLRSLVIPDPVTGSPLVVPNSPWTDV
ncbi:ABC transporter ATP-binding protein [Streptomyces sp. HUAS MG47]